MTREERIQRQEEKREEMLCFERDLYSQKVERIAGVDEVGRGPLAGPVVAAAVILPWGCPILGIDDSKKLSEKRRDILYEQIIDGCHAWGIGLVGPEEIDEINILQATKKAMTDAVKNLCATAPVDHLLIDCLTLPQVDLPQTSIVKGDNKSLSIAAASIVAKVYRDRMMIKWAQKYPGYGFERNKGYGTREHYQGIRELGMTPIHRRSFLKGFTDPVEVKEYLDK